MQEPPRYNLLSVLQKSLKCAQKKIYLHRIIYIANWIVDEASAQQESRAFIILIDSNIKLINDEYCEEIVTGFGIFYTGYLINIVEGPEETLVKHLRMLVDTLNENMQKTPEIDRMKVLLVSHHINKRYYNTWNGRQATPPLLLDKIEPTTSPEVTSRHIQNCIMKLYRISEYLRNQTPNLLRATMDNITDLCRAYLPEFNLLDFLLQSPALIDLKEYIDFYGSVPKYSLYQEKVWPVPSDFIPYNIIGEDDMKKLMSKDPEFLKRVSKEDEASTETKSLTERHSLSDRKSTSQRKSLSDRHSLSEKKSLTERHSWTERKSLSERHSFTDRRSPSYRKSLTDSHAVGEKSQTNTQTLMEKKSESSHEVVEKKSLTLEHPVAGKKSVSISRALSGRFSSSGHIVSGRKSGSTGQAVIGRKSGSIGQAVVGKKSGSIGQAVVGKKSGSIGQAVVGKKSAGSGHIVFEKKISSSAQGLSGKKSVSTGQAVPRKKSLSDRKILSEQKSKSISETPL